MKQETPTLQSLLKDAIEARVTDIHVSLPGIVQKYDAAKQMADIQPTLKKKYGDGTVTNLPLLSNVPVIFPRSGNAYLHIPLKKDDTVLLIFCERSIDTWLQKGGIVDPDDYRKHALSDAVAIPGLFPMGSEIDGQSDKVDLVNGDAILRLSEDGKSSIGKVGSTPTENAVLGLVLKQYLENIHQQYSDILDLLIGGDIFIATTLGAPTAPNPVRTPQLLAAKTALAALKTTPISDKLFLSDILFTEKGI
jgi:hypothetical protein